MSVVILEAKRPSESEEDFAKRWAEYDQKVKANEDRLLALRERVNARRGHR